MGFFSSRKLETFEAHLKEVLNFKHEFKNNSLRMAVKSISEMFGRARSARELEGIIRSRNNDIMQIKQYLQRDGFDASKFDVAMMNFKKEKGF